MMGGVSRRQFDTVAAWSLDRLGRSTVHVIHLLDELQAKDVDVYLLAYISKTLPSGSRMAHACW